MNPDGVRLYTTGGRVIRLPDGVMDVIADPIDRAVHVYVEPGQKTRVYAALRPHIPAGTLLLVREDRVRTLYPVWSGC